jgi:hypothetical protein
MIAIDRFQKMKRFQTDFLCAESSFATGFGSVLNLGGELYRYNLSPNPDEIAFWQDWNMVGQDMRDAINQFMRESAFQSANAGRTNTSQTA